MSDFVEAQQRLRRQALADAWDEGAASRQCKCAAWDEGECGCGNYPSEANPYRTPREVPELFPGVQDRLDALTIRKGTP